MIAAMYLRKSRAEENEPVAETLQRHSEALTVFAAANNITVAAVYEEVASGDSLHGRPEMLRLLNDINKYGAVLCMDIDRLGRGTMHEQGLILETLRTAGTFVVTPGKTYDLNDDMDDSLISFKALFAREEYKLIRGRLKRGVLKTVRDGGYVANAPYGYSNVRVNKRPTLTVVENEAAAVRMIFDMYCSGSGCQIIADTLNAAGYKPRRTDKFGRTSIAKIIRNPVYMGKVAWNQCAFKKPKHPGEKHVRRLNPREDWIITNGNHEAIISAEVFSRANSVLDGRYHPPYRKHDELKNPLSGVLYCANCGSVMIRQPLYGRKYDRPMLMCKTKGCCMSTAMDIVEDAFISALEAILQRLKVHASVSSVPAANYAAVEQQTKAEITRLKKQLSSLHDLLERGVYDADTFLERRDALQTRIDAASCTLMTVKKAPEPDAVIARLETIFAAYWDGTPMERNILVKNVVARAEYRKPKGSPLKTPPSIEIAEWFSFT